MKKIILLAIILMSFVSLVTFAQEDESFYKALTKDGEVSEIGKVRVGKWMPIPYTLDECDYWIGVWKGRVEDAIKTVEEWKKIRAKVLEEAKKVKLKEKSDGQIL